MSIIDASLYEPIVVGVNADTTLYTADSETWPTADGGVLAGAQDFVDAEVIPAVVVGEPGGGYVRPPQPYPIEAYGDGVLPQLEGDAIGVVIAAGAGRATLAGLRGSAEGSAGVAGRCAGALVVRALAHGSRGEIGAGDGVLQGLSVASAGVVGVRGTGAGTIVKLNATAVGQCEDDAAAVIAFLLAA